MIAVAIDGPAGAGKSTIAKLVAKKLGFIYVDTGALYRAVGLNVLNTVGSDYTNEEVIATLPSIKVELKFENNEQHVILNGEDVNSKIRTEEVSMAASNVSAIPEVRAFLFDLQQNFATIYNVVMDGRDIGTVVLPNAQVKIFLTASAQVRADRRYKEQVEKGLDVSFDDILADIEKRDYNDSNRAIAPLKPAEDSFYLDSSELSIEESVATVLKTINEKCGL